MLRKSLISLFVLGAGAVFSGTMGPVCQTTNVTLPCESDAWEIGGHALYLQPFVSAFATNHQTYSIDNATGVTSYAQFGTASTYNWGFQLEAARHFNKGKDINVNWYHFRGTTNKNYPDYTINDGIASQNISLNDSWDHVNIEYGNQVNLEENAHMRFHAGFMYARVASDSINNLYYPTYTNNNNYQSEFSGFGVRGGMSLHYNMTSALNLHGNIAGGLLAGTTKSSYWEGTTEITGTSVLDTHSLGVVAPEVDAKAGLQYQYDLSNGHLMFDAGWLWTTYINTLDDNAEDSFGIQGLYFGARWIGNIA